jgi:hypothetical protein
MSHGGPEHHEAAAPAAGAEHHGAGHDAAAAHPTGHPTDHPADHPADHPKDDKHPDKAHDAAHDDTKHGKDAAHPAASGKPSEFAIEARAAWERAKHTTGGFLMNEKEPVQEVSLLKTPLYIIRDWVKGSVGNVLRRGKEIIQPAAATLEAGWNTVSKPFLSPMKTLFHPIKYLANIPRIVTAGTRTIKNFYKAPFSGTNEAYQGIVQDPLERVDYKVAKLGKVGRGIATFNNKVANVLGWPLRTIDDIAKWGTDWIDDADNYIGGVQGA